MKHYNHKTDEELMKQAVERDWKLRNNDKPLLTLGDILCATTNLHTSGKPIMKEIEKESDRLS